MTELIKMGALHPEILKVRLHDPRLPHDPRRRNPHFVFCDALSDFRFALKEVLISLASFEKNLPRRKKEAIAETEDDYAKLRDKGPHGGYDPEQEEEALKGIGGLFDHHIPLLTYYNSLIAAAAAMEFFVPMLWRVITGKELKYRGVVEKLAQMGMDCSQYCNFHEVRNALVHDGGVAAADKKGQKWAEAAEALGFSLSCASKYSGGLSDGRQIIIDRATLEKCIVESHNSIVQLLVKAAQAGKGE